MNEQVALLFRELADLTPAERENVLAARDVPAPIRAEVESLLQYDSSHDHLVTDCVGQAAVSALQAETRPADPFCGPYRLVRPLGSGGMGAVYLAERSDGELQQTVAIKMLRAGAESAEWQQRFHRERQLLAYLNHPYIARLLDAGRTAHGRPYLVMEYVDGKPIDQAITGMTLHNQMTLFLKVCDGVAHAHRHLIIHRDLKPSNILVDAAGQPKILDFGIAKLLDESPAQTQTVERLLTPAYASPEQLRGAVQTTATDVYSLGAVLYKLVTGRSPHQSETGELQAIEIVAGTRVICPPRRLNPTLPADIAFILEKSLRIEPHQRFASVEALANDIGAYLDSRPLQARSGDALYRTRRFLRRYWLPVTAAALVIASLSGGLYIANRQRELAQQRFQDVRQLANKLFEIDSTVSQIPGTAQARQQIVDTSLEYLRRLAPNAQGDADLELEIGNAYRRVAEAEGVTSGPNLGQVDNAERDLAIADRMIGSVLRRRPADRMALLSAAEVASDRMAVAWQGGRSEEKSVGFARQAQSFLDLLNLNKTDAAKMTAGLYLYANIAHQYMIADRLDEALALCKRGKELSKLLGQPYLPARFLDTEALSLRYQGDLDAALVAIRECVRLNERFLSAPDAPQNLKINLSMELAREGWILGGGDLPIDLGRTAEAVLVLQRAFDIADDLVHKDAKDESARSRLFLAGGPLGEILRHSDAARALSVLDHTYRDMAQVSSPLLKIREVGVLASAAAALGSLGRRKEARARLDEAFALLSSLGLYPAGRIEAGSETAQALAALADYEADSGNITHAVAIYRELLTNLLSGNSKPERSLQDAVALSSIWTSLAALERKLGQTGDALAIERERADLWRKWDLKIPNNPFVRRQIGSFSANSGLQSR